MTDPIRYGTREWERDPSHFPLPLSPAFASVYLAWQEEAFRTVYADFGIPAETVQSRTRDGYLYTRAVPLGLRRPPPGWVAALGLRLWWLHPALRRRVRRGVRMARAEHGTALLKRWETEWRPAALAAQRAAAARELAVMDAEALLAELDALLDRTRAGVTIHFLLHAAIALPLAALERFLAEFPALAPLSVAELVQGSSGASSAPASALSGIVAPLRDEPTVLDQAASLPPQEGLALLRDRSPGFARLLDEYLARFGASIVGRYEFVTPTLSEQPWALVPSLLRAAHVRRPPDQPGDGRHDRRIEEAAARLRDPEQERRFRSLVFAARRAYGVRDDNAQITFASAFGLIRLVLLECGRRLVAAGALSQPEDVFFLRIAETRAALTGRERPAPALVERRRAGWRRALQTPPPRSLGRPVASVRLDGLPVEVREMTAALVGYMRGIMAVPDTDVAPAPIEGESVAAEAMPTELRGIGAVRGRYTGVARVLLGEADFARLGAGEVLVCAMTSPAWAAILPLAGALVTDHGGVLSHAAVIAREFGIPAVVATGRATRVIPDGSRVEVDGDHGVVAVLTPPPAPLRSRAKGEG